MIFGDKEKVRRPSRGGYLDNKGDGAKEFRDERKRIKGAGKVGHGDARWMRRGGRGW